MMDIDIQIAQLESEYAASKLQTEALEAELTKLKREKSAQVAASHGIKSRDYMRPSDALLAKLKTYSWWRQERHGGYNPFEIKYFGVDMVFIEDVAKKGGTFVPLELVLGCEKVAPA